MPTLFPSRAFRRARTRAPRYLLALGIDDLSPELPTGQTLALTRTTGRTVLDGAGRLGTIVHSQLPWSAVLNSATGVYEPVLDVSDTATNRCLQSENFGTTWAAIGTPTRTAAAKTVGDYTLDLLGDDTAATLEGYSQVITFTGDAVKAGQIVLAAGSSTSTVVRLRDTTAAANRLLATITWAAGVPTVAMTIGTHLKTIALAEGAYRFCFQTTAVTAANTNQVEVYPATTSALAIANTGTVYAGGVQWENAEYPRPYIKTTTAVATSNQDDVSVSLAFPPQNLTIYGRISSPVWRGALSSLASPPGILLLGNGATASLQVQFNASATPTIGVSLWDGAGTAGVIATSPAIPAGDVIEFAIQLENPTTAPRCRVDAGTGFGSDGGPAPVPFSAWSSAILYVGRLNVAAVGGSINAGFRRLIIAPGLQTIAQLRGPQP